MSSRITNHILQLACLLLLLPFPAVSQGITVTSGATIRFSGAATLQIDNGGLTNSGTIVKGAETVTFSGTTARTISGSSPTALHNVAVTNTGGLTTQAPLLETNDLTVAASSRFTIDPGKKTTVNGTLTNEGDNTRILLRSSPSGTASLLHHTPNVKATAERYVANWGVTGGHTGLHFLSCPMVREDIRPEFVPSGSLSEINQDFYKWDEVSNQWVNTRLEGGVWNSDFETEFVKGRGYLVAYRNNVTKVFRDSINITGVTISGLTNTTGKTYAGWHLVGNPFASAIKWGQGTWTKENIGAFAQIWNSSAKSYRVLAGAGEIPPMNGFMVYTTGNGTLTIPDDARMHTDSNWYKSAAEPRFLLTAIDPAGDSFQETIIRFDEGASEGFDKDEDCTLMSGYAPLFYTRAGGKYLALNTLPQLTNETRIPLGFIKNENSQFSIALREWMPGAVAYLTDLKTNTTVNLSQQLVYSFTSVQGDDPNRFLLHFGSVGTDELPAEKPFSVYSSGSVITIAGRSGQVRIDEAVVYNMIGQVVSRAGRPSELPVRFSLHVPTGYYLVRVIAGETVMTARVFIQ